MEIPLLPYFTLTSAPNWSACAAFTGLSCPRMGMEQLAVNWSRRSNQAPSVALPRSFLALSRHFESKSSSPALRCLVNCNRRFRSVL